MHIALTVIEVVLVTLCLAVSVWLWRQRKQMKRRTHLGLQVCGLLVLGATLLSMIFPGPLQKLAYAASAVGAGCNSQNSSECFTGTNLNNRDPGLYNCWNHHANIINVETIKNKNGDKVGTIRIWYSYDCNTNWAQVIGGLDTVGQDKSDALPVFNGQQTTSAQRADGREPYGYPLYAPLKGGKPQSVACSFGQHLKGSNNEVLQWDIQNIKVNISAPGTTTFASHTITTSGSHCTASSPMVYAPVDPTTAEVRLNAQNDDEKSVTEAIYLKFSQNGLVDRFSPDPSPTPTPKASPGPVAAIKDLPCRQGNNNLEQAGWQKTSIGQGVSGSVQCQGDRTLKISGTGSGMGNDTNKSDGLYYVHTDAHGSSWFLQVHVSIKNIETGKTPGDIGIMMRVDSSEKTAFAAINIHQGLDQTHTIDFYDRPQAKTNLQKATDPKFSMALSSGGWLRLTRTGNVIKADFAPDSRVSTTPNQPLPYTSMGQITFSSLPDTVLLGMYANTNQDNVSSGTTNSVFTNILAGKA